MTTFETLRYAVGLSDFNAHESARHLQIAASADTAESFRAFVEKRKPRFT